MYPYPGQQNNQGQPGYPPQGYPNQAGYPPSGGYPPYPSATPGYPPANPGYPAAPAYPAASAYPQAQPQYPGSQPYYPQPNVGFDPSQQLGYPPQPTAYPQSSPSHQPYPSSGYPTQYPQQPTGYPQGAYPHSPTHQHATSTHTSHSHSSPHGGHTMTSQQSYQEIPTIREGPFDANADAKALRAAMKGFGTDEAAIINVVTKRTNAQRVQITNAFKTSYGKDLIKDIKSEISGNFEKAVIALMTPRYDYMAQSIHDAIDGIGTKEHVLVDVLCTATNQEIHWIKAAYQRLYGKHMEKEVASDLSGFFGRLMVSICAAGRDENPVVNGAMVAQDAQDLHSAGLKKMGTDESEFIRVLMCRSYAHLRNVFQEYQKISGQDIEKSIKSEFSGDIEDGLLAVVKCVKNRAAYFAERLHKAMAGAGTKDNVLIYILVTRAEIDLESVKTEYNRMYHKSLVAVVQSETSGDYKKTLSALCG